MSFILRIFVPIKDDARMEKVLQYMWKNRIWGDNEKTLTDGREITLLDQGVLNTDAGPDFFNAKIKIDDVEWVGNVEIHTKASDWFRHNHDKDLAYDNIILHVVAVDDAVVRRADGSKIPQLHLPLSKAFAESYSMLIAGLPAIRCASFIPELPSITVTDWLETLACERLQRKASQIMNILEMHSGDWEQTCFIVFARSLGFGLNSEPFETLTKSIPLNVLHHHSDSPLQLQALLFGQAGMLDMSTHILDEYYQRLCREYFFLCRKYSLRPMSSHLWKFAKTRPANFPHRRIAMLAKFVEGGFSLMRKMLDAKGNPDILESLFDVSLSGYWDEHFAFDYPAKSKLNVLGKQSVNLILINTIAPLYYAYGISRGDREMEESALDLLSMLKPESNSIISQWNTIGLTADNALRSQALIQLRKEYCDVRKCLHCRIGNKMLRTIGYR